MTTAQRIKRVMTLLGNEVEVDDATISEYLSISESTIAAKRYPFGIPDGYTLEARYEDTCCELAARYIARLGGLGEVQHNENGISRVWASPDDRDLLARIIPVGKVM